MDWQTEPTRYLGIDPGNSGGIALLGTEGTIVLAEKMPATEKDVSDLIGSIARSVRFAYIERVHAMPKQGVISSFTFGVSYGGLRMALVAHGIPFEAVTPGKWQRTMGLLIKGRTVTQDEKVTKTEKKNLNKARAQELFPGQRVTHAVADALLIAECARRDRETKGD